MKEWLSGLNRIYLATVTAIQIVCAITWVVIKLITGGSVSALGLISALIVIAAAGAFVFGKRKLWVVSVLFVFTLPGIFHTAASGHIANLPDLPKGSVTQLLVQRFSWPNLYKVGYTYFIEGVDNGNVIGLTVSPEKLWSDMFPRVEGFYGTYSSEIYKEFAKTSLATYKSEIVLDILKDFSEYLFAPFTMELNLFGVSHGSYSGKNYEDFVDGTCRFGRFYYHFGFASLCGLVILSILSMIVRVKKTEANITLFCIEAIALISLYDIFFPLRGFDYKNAAWIILIETFYLIYAMRDVNADS